jgi:alpha-glucoside transport system substrate-binding protein
VHTLDGVLDSKKLTLEYGPTWLDFERVGTDHLYGVVVKANVKSLLWYNEHAFHQPLNRFADLAGIDGPWCMAMSDPPNSGWPGTDWIEDILLHQAGWRTYAKFADGTLPWDSPQVKAAWRTWGTIISAPGRINGGRLGAMLTAYGSSTAPMFTSPPGCLISHGATLSGTGSARPKAGVDYDFAPFPTSGSATPSHEVAADLIAMFRPSRPAEDFIRYLAGPDAQAVWPSKEKEQAFTPNLTDLHHRLGKIKGPIGARIDTILTSGQPLCFDASDWMPDAMASAFYRAALEYLADPTDTRLDALVPQLESVRETVYGSTPKPSPNPPCGPAAR